MLPAPGCSSPGKFLSTPSARRATLGYAGQDLSRSNFYPRPPRGGRRVTRLTKEQLRTYFYPRPPRGGRLLAHSTVPKLAIFLSTPSARRATRAHERHKACIPISIHALREEGDLEGHAVGAVRRAFLSTPSARRATSTQCKSCLDKVISIHALREEGDPVAVRADHIKDYFYPRPPRGGRHRHTPRCFVHKVISIHALREEGDQCSQSKRLGTKKFLSTPSARRATCHQLQKITHRRYFYPRPPRGGRQSPK